MHYSYKVVPFIGQSRGQLSAADVARQLETAINQNAADGWEFYQLSDVNIEVRPGCFAGLFGAEKQYVRFDQLIFRSNGRPTASTHGGGEVGIHEELGARRSLVAPGHQGRFDTTAAAKAWQQKSDEEVLIAAAQLHQYTAEGREIIRAELRRRSLTEKSDPRP